MAKNQPSWIPFDDSGKEQIRSHAPPPDSWHLKNTGEVFGNVLPEALITKLSQLTLIASSGTGIQEQTLLFLIERKDGDAIDQMPFGIVSRNEELCSSGVLVQHADYDGRTEPIPQEYASQVAESGLFPITQLPHCTSGPIKDIGSSASVTAAYQLVLEFL